MAVKFQVGAEIKTVPEKEEIDRKINEQTSQIANLEQLINQGGSSGGMTNEFKTAFKNWLVHEAGYYDDSSRTYTNQLIAILEQREPAKLVSISATYNGNSVPLGTDVASLNYTVIAHYDDNTQAELTDYTVSGSIATVGNNTITIRYSNKSTTLIVVGYEIVQDVETTEEYTILEQNSGCLDRTTGDIVVDTSWYTTEYIPINDNITSYARNTSRISDNYLCWYDENRGYLGNGGHTSYGDVTSQYGSGYTYDGRVYASVPNKAKFVRVSWRTSATFESIFFKHNIRVDNAINLELNKVYYYTYDEDSTDSYIMSDEFIPVIGNYVQARQILRRKCDFYDVNKDFISSTTVENNLGNNIQIPSGTKFIKLSNTNIITKGANNVTVIGTRLIMFTDTELTSW